MIIYVAHGHEDFVGDTMIAVNVDQAKAEALALEHLKYYNHVFVEKWDAVKGHLLNEYTFTRYRDNT